VSDGLEYSAGLAGLAELPGGSGDLLDVRLAAARPDCDISAQGAPVRTLVIAAREDIEVARQTRAVIAEN